MDLNLAVESLSYLTAEAVDPNSKLPVSTVCDLDGMPLGPASFPIACYRDSFSGKRFARIAQQLPSDTDARSQALKLAILAKKPVYVDSTDGRVRGWYIEAPDYSLATDGAEHTEHVN